MSNYIFDASFTLAELLKPEGSSSDDFQKIARLVNANQAQIYAPILLWTEVANALRFSITDPDKATKIYRDFANLPITPCQLTVEQFLAIIKMAYQTKTTLYDSSYHYLAIELDGTFLTCDKDYYRKAKSLGHIEVIVS